MFNRRRSWRPGSDSSPPVSPLSSPPYSKTPLESNPAQVLLERPPAYVEEAPPDYTPLDDNVSTYTLSAPLIATGTSIRYQLKLERTAKGKPLRICIRRLMPTESRRLSRSSSVGSIGSSSTLSRVSSAVEYDSDATMYTITRLAVLGVGAVMGMSAGEAPVEIKGWRASTLPGTIHMTMQGRRCLFHHRVRNPANDMLLEENRRKMEKYGYHGEKEWTRTLLFSATRGGQDENGRKLQAEWRDAEDKMLAREGEEIFSFEKVLEPKFRDVLVTCWIARSWHAGTLKWESEGLGG